MSATLVRRARPWVAMLLLAGLAVAAVVYRPAWQAHRRTAFVQRLASAARVTDDDRQLRRLVDQLGQLTPDSIDVLAELAASQRAAAAQPAQQAIDLLVGRWEVRPEETLADDQQQHMLRLAAAFASEIDRFGPVGRAWAESILLQLIDESEHMTPRRAADLLAACDVALSRLPAPTEPPRVLPTTTLPAPTTVALPKASVDLAPLTGIPVDPAAEPDSVSRSVPAVDPFENAASAGAPLPAERLTTPTPLVWQGRTSAKPRPTTGSSTLSQSNRPADPDNPATDTLPETDPLDVAADKPIDIPSPQLVRRMAREYRRMSTDELDALAQTSSRYLRRAVVDELEARRVARGSQPASETTHSTPIDPEQRIRAAQLLPAREARRVLRRLVTDADPLVRLEALTALATTADPHLDEIAQRRAATDQDARVARLASEILNRLER